MSCPCRAGKISIGDPDKVPMEDMMKTCIVFHSYSGITRGIAGRIATACGGGLIEVKPKEAYGTLSAYTTGCLRARREEADPVIPETIDLSGCDLIVLGTPVWAWKATPVTNGAIAAMRGCEGKKAVVFATCGAQHGDTLKILARALAAKGVTVVGDIAFTKRDVADESKVNALIAMVQAAGTKG
jgi:multimeric flavodoxin WrbA